MSTCVISNGLEDVRVVVRTVKEAVDAANEWFPGDRATIMPSVPLVTEPVRKARVKAWVVES